jgi:3-oxoacyl-[acyl-carrier protein] reductase
LKKITLEDWNAVLQVNLSGPFHCIRAAMELIRPGGRIVNLSSVSAKMGFFGQANYSSSKAGVIALTKVTARELAKKQVTVNTIAPGFIDTEMTRTMPQEATKAFLQQIPLGRMGTVDDIVGAALFLCSPLAAYITGHVLDVNGGFLMD